MLQQGQNWDLFGYDMRRVWRHWLSAWKDCLWGYDSPIKARLDEVVRVEGRDGVNFFHAGVAVEDQPMDCEAFLLPEELVLSKTLSLPLAVEADLDAVMSFEVVANSPFPESDTGYGWRIDQRGETTFRVQLVIVSLSATMAYLGREYDCHDAHMREVWARLGDSVVVIQGFGEQKRLGRYNGRLKRVAMISGVSVFALIMITALSAGFKYIELNKLQEMSSGIETAAASPVQLRGTLSAANATIASANSLIAEYPGPHAAIAHLSKLLGDDVSLEYFSMSGRDIKIRGLAKNAAAVVQQLTEEPSFESVVSPQAITTQGSAGLERFFLDIRLAGR